MQSHPHALENAGRVALMRGPLLYCVEGIDHPGLDLRDLVIPGAVELDIVERPDLLGGVVTLCARGQVAHARWRLVRSALPGSRHDQRQSQPPCRNHGHPLLCLGESGTGANAGVVARRLRLDKLRPRSEEKQLLQHQP